MRRSLIDGNAAGFAGFGAGILDPAACQRLKREPTRHARDVTDHEILTDHATRLVQQHVPGGVRCEEDS